jgi:iron complex transport system permease protein
VLNVMLLGEAEAGHLGLDIERVKRLVIGCVALVVGATVAVAGIIGFVGLIVPHLLRVAIGPDHRYVFPGAALLGATILLGADLVARTLVAPAELPLGVVTATLGAPFFL